MRNGLTKDLLHKLNVMRGSIKTPSLDRVARLIKKKEEKKKAKHAPPIQKLASRDDSTN